MPILNIQPVDLGLVGVTPRVVYINTNDTLAQVTATGYLNTIMQQGFRFSESDMCLVATKPTPSSSITEVGWLEVSFVNPYWSLVPINSPGEIVLPTIANYLAHFSDALGTLTSAPANVINAGNIQAGLITGTAGTLLSYPSSANKGALILAAVANTGNTNVTISNAAMGQASVISIIDPGSATANFILSKKTGTQNITVGSLQVDAGSITSGLAAGGFVGLLKAFPTTGSKGFIALQAAVNATGDFGTTISNSTAQAQIQVITIPDVGGATGNFILSGSSLSPQHITSGGLQVDAGSIASGINTGGFVGLISAFPTTASSGWIELQAAVNATGDFGTTISNSTAQAQTQVITIPDVGGATGNFILSGLVSGGVQHINLGSFAVDGGSISSGLTTGGFVGLIKAYPTTATSGSIGLSAAVNATGDFGTLISNAIAQAQAQVITIPDSGSATANFLLDTGAANILSMQEFVGLNSVLLYSAGTWTITRIAQGNYVARHTAADDTTIIGIDITPMIRIASDKGFRLDSFDVIYSIATLALDAHTLTLDRIAYANNVAVSSTAIALTGSLATATNANPYATNIAITTPGFDITADSKYVLELTVDNSATSDYDFYGIMLKFSQTIA